MPKVWIAFYLLFYCYYVAYPSLAVSQALNLRDAYALTLKQSETLQLKVQDLRIAEAQYRQSVAALYPQLNLGSTYRLRDSEDFGVRGGRSSDSVDDGELVSRSERERYQYDAAVNVRQPIFKGFRDILLAQASKSEVAASSFDELRERELLYLDVGLIFHQTNSYASDLKILESTQHVLRDRIAELGRFIDLGKSRPSEILAAESETADLLSTKEQIKGLWGASKELLAFLTGLPSHELNLETNSESPIILNLDAYVEKSKNRVDLQAAEARRTSASKQLTATEREHWPSISFEGNFYPYETPDINRDWEVLLRFEMPIFDGGAINSRVSQRLAILRSSELQLQQLKRTAEREVRVAFNDFTAANARVKALKALHAASVKNYQSQRQDYSVGVVTNLDVLQSIRATQDAQRRLIDAEVALQLAAIRLEVAAGGIA